MHWYVARAMKRRILVVDDDRDHAESIADILAMHGHDVDMAYTGEEALQRFSERDYDLTLMDVKLPGMNGIEAFIELRRQRADARVIMMTGFSVEKLLSQAMANGAHGVLYKPLAIGNLLRAVSEMPDRAA
jgi:two-component system, NtrC family, response regulator HydG